MGPQPDIIQSLPSYPHITSPLFNRLLRLDRRPLDSPRLLRRPLPDIPSPAPQHAHHFRRYGDGERDADEDEGFVDSVGEC